MSQTNEGYVTWDMYKKQIILVKAIEKTICELGYSDKLYANFDELNRTLNQAIGEAQLIHILEQKNTE